MRLTVGIYRYAVSELAGGGQGEGRETIGKTRWRVLSLPRKSPKVVNEGEGHPRVARRTSARRLILNRSRILTFSFDFTAICNFSSRLAGSERKKKTYDRLFSLLATVIVGPLVSYSTRVTHFCASRISRLGKVRAEKETRLLCRERGRIHGNWIKS